MASRYGIAGKVGELSQLAVDGHIHGGAKSILELLHGANDVLVEEGTKGFKWVER